jgi:hypothetical protein
MVPTYSPLTPEGQIEGIGRFAEGLKRMLSNPRHRK